MVFLLLISVLCVQLYDLDDCGVWFIRFALDGSFRRVACGTNGGAVLVFDLQKPGKPMAVVQRPGADPQAKKFTVPPRKSGERRFL